MDIASLTAFLAPLLPALLNIGGRVAKEAADAAGDEAVGFARRLWERLRGHVESKPAAQDAVDDVAAHPEDEDLQTVLKVQLRKLLEDDPQLAAEIGQLWEEGQAASIVTVNVTASGAGAVAIGRDAVGSSITTTAPPPVQ